MIERNDPMLDTANQVIAEEVIIQKALENRTAFRKNQLRNCEVLSLQQAKSFFKMSERRKKIFLNSLTHFNPKTGQIATTRYGRKHGLLWIPMVHTVVEKIGAPMERMMAQWMESLNYA